MSYDKASFVPVQPNEPEDNLIEWVPPRRRCIPREESEHQFRNPLDRWNSYVKNMNAIGVDLAGCKHEYGFAHFWNNPGMEPPCRIVKADGQWHLRKSCAHIGKVIRREDGWFEYETPEEEQAPRMPFCIKED